MSEVIQRTANGVDVISLDTFNCDRRTLCIRGEITQESAFDFALTAAYLNSLSETEAITVYINSPGGDIDAGLLMYDVIQASPAPIRVVALGTAYSMAALLFASGLHGNSTRSWQSTPARPGSKSKKLRNTTISSPLTKASLSVWPMKSLRSTDW